MCDLACQKFLHSSPNNVSRGSAITITQTFGAVRGANLNKAVVADLHRAGSTGSYPVVVSTPTAQHLAELFPRLGCWLVVRPLQRRISIRLARTTCLMKEFLFEVRLLFRW